MQQTEIRNFSCARMKEPLALPREDVTFSYGIHSEERGIVQKAYRITVGTTPDTADMWDSGIVEDAETLDLPYGGKTLQSFTKYYCRAESLVTDGTEEVWLTSETASFRMGALDPSDLAAQWIEDDSAGVTDMPYRAGYLSAPADTADAKKWVTVDLGTEKSFDTVILYGFRPHDLPSINDFPGYAFPLRFRVLASCGADFADAAILADHSETRFPNPGVQPVYIECGSVTARYIRVEALELDQYRTGQYAFGLSQIEVMDNDANLALGCAVTALDECPELPDAYGPDKLTDGEYLWHPAGPAKQAPQPYFRKTFTLDKIPQDAILYYSAFGLCEWYVNGVRVEENAYLLPGWTDFATHIEYRAVDVTSLLREGENEIAAQTADGWYAGRIGMINVFGPRTLRGKYGVKPALYGQLRLVDGAAVRQIVTDESWESTLDSPLRASDIYDGEYYDARYAMDKADFRPVVIADKSGVDMLPMQADPVTGYRNLAPIDRWTTADGHLVFDFGEVNAGTIRVQLRGKAGRMITLRYAEAIREDRTCCYTHLRGAIVRDRYIPATDGTETYEPRFTYHGFRYVEVFCGSGPVAVEDIEMIVLSSCPESTGQYTFENPLYQWFSDASRVSMQANVVNVVTDCIERDERLAWRMAGLTYGGQWIESEKFWERNLTEILYGEGAGEVSIRGQAPDALNITGGNAVGGITLKHPYYLYLYYGNRRYLRRTYAYLKNRYACILRQYGSAIHGDPNHKVDWLNLDHTLFPFADGTSVQTTDEQYSTVSVLDLVNRLATYAELLGETEDAVYYREEQQKQKALVLEHFCTPDGALKHPAQGGYGMLLHRGLPEAAERQPIADAMAESVRREGKRFTCGVYTAGDALFALSDNGHHDLAYALFANEEGPSYGYMYRHGATSLWERWDTYNHYLAHLQPTKRWQAPLDCQTELSDSGNAHIGMNSYNHIEHTYSSGWLTECVLGLRGDISMGGGYRHFTVHPCWGEENRAARGEFTTPRGTIVVDWRYGENGTYTMDLTVPANCFARVYLPAALEHCFCDKTALAAVRECNDIRPETDCTSFAVVSGVYRFTCTATV